jgi:hypothetical protein
MGRVVILICVVAVGGCHMFGRTGGPESQTTVHQDLPDPAPTRPPESPFGRRTADPSRNEHRPAADAEPAPKPAAAQPVSREKGSASIGPDDAPTVPEPLELAADCLDRGDSAGAARHLAEHVDRHPDQVLFRLQLAELLYEQERYAAAGRQFEAAIGHAQDGAPAVRKHLIHCHTRLMEVARATEDTYAERLHRGIGLYLVGVQLSRKEEADEAERLLCKAVAELREAQAVRPADARAGWYLYRVWVELGQPRPAARALEQARAGLGLTDLTAAEARAVALVR